MNKKIQKIISIILSLFMCITFLPVVASAESQSREWFVSVTGDDVNGTGTISNPFKTLQKGADRLSAGDTLYIRGGVYDEAFTVSASGTPDAPITIKNYNNEEVIIRATTNLTGWTTQGGNIWACDMPWNMEDVGDENALFNGADSFILARYPNLPEGGSVLWPEVLIADFADRTSDYLGQKGIIEDAELDMPDGYWDGGKVSIEAGVNWFNVSATIKSYTKGVLNLVNHDFNTSEYYDECPGDPYYIYDHINALDAEGEFYFDRANNKMYVYSAVDPNTLEMGARSEKYIMDLTGQSYINVEGLNLRGAPPVMDNTHHINFEWIDLSDLSRSFSIAGEHNTLKNSHIYNGQYSLVGVSGRYNAVFNCLIEYGGLAGKSSVNLGAGGLNCYYGYNTVRYAGRQAAAFNGVNSVFEYNDVYGVGYLTHDTGPHYTVVNSMGMSEFRYCWIHDNYSDGANFGLYYDNSSADVAIHHNVVWNSANNGEGELRKDGWVAYISNSPATGMSVYNNTFIGDAHMAAYVGMSAENRMINNIFLGEVQSNVKFSVQRNNMVGWLDPKFVDIDNLDFRLSADSVAIDSGMVIEGINESYVGNAPDLGAYEYGGEYWIPGHNWENIPEFEHKFPNYIKWHNVVANGGFEDDQDFKPELISETRMFNPDYYGWSVMEKTEGQIDQEFSNYFNGKVNGEVRRTGNTGVRLGSNLYTTYPGDEAVDISTTIINLYREMKGNLSNYPELLSSSIPGAFYSLLESSSNLYPKGGFEDETYLLGTEQSAVLNTDEEAASGTRSMKYYDLKYQWSGLKTSIPATGHRKFRISFNFKADVVNSAFTMRVIDHHPTDYDKVNDRQLAHKYTKFSTTDWTPVSFDLDTDGPTSGITINSVYSNQVGGHYYVDDFAVLDITEAVELQEAAADYPEAKAIIDEALADKYITSEELALAVKNCVASMLDEDRVAAIELLVPILTDVRNSRISAGAGVTYTIDNLKPGREYKMHCSAWVKDLSDKVVFSVKHNGATLAEYTAVSSNWTDEFITFTAPENGDPVVIEIWKPEGRAAAYIDDVAVREVDPIPGAYRSTDTYMENTDFESEYLWPWYSFDGKLELVETDKGQSLKVTDGRAMQDVNMLPVNTELTFSADFKLAMEDAELKDVEVVIYAIDNSTNGQRQEYNLGKVTIDNDEWTHYEGNIEISGYTDINSTGFTAGLVDGKGTFLMDNVSVEKAQAGVTPVSYTTSPDYIKLGGAELLYNDTIEKDGKKYMSFTMTHDYAGSYLNRGVIVVRDNAGPDGEELETLKYIEYYLTGIKYTDSSGKSLDSLLSNLPQAIQNKIIPVERRVSSAYWANSGAPNSEHFKPAYSYTKASLPTGNEMFKHGKYLASQMLDNPPVKGDRQKAVTAEVACVSDYVTYSSMVYSPAQNAVVSSGVNTYYTEGSVFPTFYVDADILKELKADINSMGNNMRQYFVQNYTITQLSSLYTTDELKQIGFLGNVKEVKLDNTNCELQPGGTIQLNAEVSPLDNIFDSSVVWSTDNEAVATVVNGLVTCTGYGTAKITVASVSNPDVLATCTIVANKKVTGVTLDKTEIVIEVGETQTLNPAVLPEDATNKKVTWQSNDENVATVDEDGVVTAKGKGEATVTVTTEDGGYTATCKVMVTVSVTSVSLDRTSLEFNVGETETLVATVLPENATNKNVVWTSSDDDVATVADGLVTAKGKGKATITVTTADGNFTATCEVDVKVRAEEIVLDKTSIDMLVGDTETLVATVLPENATNKNVVWTSSNDDVATVVDGVVTAISAGEATITVKAEDGGYMATCIVKVANPFNQVVKPEKVEGSSFVYDGKTFYYLNSIIEHNGKKYFKIFSKEEYVDWAGDSYYLLTERPDGGVNYVQRHAKIDGKNLQDMSKNLGVFGDYIIPADYEWSCGTIRYNNANVKAYLTGSINVPSVSDYTYLINEGVVFKYDGSQSITSTFFVYNNKTTRNFLGAAGTPTSNMNVNVSEDGTYLYGANKAKYNYVTYISEDFFVENEIDLWAAGEVLLTAITDNISKETMEEAGAWSDTGLMILYDELYKGDGLGITATEEYGDNEVTVKVVLQNNGEEAAGAGSVIIVALYSGDKFVDMAVVNVVSDVEANSITSAIPITLATAKKDLQIKTMLWNNNLLPVPVVKVHQ